jgi:hypothetical protein
MTGTGRVGVRPLRIYRTESGGDVDDSSAGRVRVLNRLITTDIAATGLNATVLLATLGRGGTIGRTPSARLDR